MARAGLIALFVAGCAGTSSSGGDDVAGDVDARDTRPYTTTPDGCDDVATDLYVTPASLPPLTADTRGAIVRCVLGPELDPAAAQAAAEANGATITADTGVRVLEIAYRTVRGDDTPAVTTATVWLPLVPRAQPVPVALIARSTSGIADSCAPSREDMPLPELGLRKRSSTSSPARARFAASSRWRRNGRRA